MASRRQHRDLDSTESALFAAPVLPVLRSAVAELSRLFERGYAQTAALALVGDCHQLRARQRLAVLRCASAERDREARLARRLEVGELRGRALAVDGFNCLITVEAALAGAVILRGRDGVLRDVAGVHGGYRPVAETEPAIAALGAVLAAAGAAPVRVFLDRPVSHSGQLREHLEARARAAGWPWEVVLTDSPDRAIVELSDWVAASSDGAVLDRCGRWVPLVDALVKAAAPDAWIVELG